MARRCRGQAGACWPCTVTCLVEAAGNCRRPPAARPRHRRAKQQTETGRIVNHMSADVNQLQMFFYPFAAQLITGPAMLITSIILLWFQIK